MKSLTHDGEDAVVDRLGSQEHCHKQYRKLSECVEELPVELVRLQPLEQH